MYTNFLAEENERLKAENEQMKYDIVVSSKLGKITSELAEKYRKALEDVREITNNFFEECGIPDDYFKRNNYSWKQHQIKALTCKIKQIQDKINEVLGDENH